MFCDDLKADTDDENPRHSEKSFKPAAAPLAQAQGNTKYHGLDLVQSRIGSPQAR